MPPKRARSQGPFTKGEGADCTARASRGALDYPTTEIGGVESLFTPEGVETLNALSSPKSASRKDRPQGKRRPR